MLSPKLNKTLPALLIGNIICDKFTQELGHCSSNSIGCVLRDSNLLAAYALTACNIAWNWQAYSNSHAYSLSYLEDNSMHWQLPDYNIHAYPLYSLRVTDQ